MASDVRTVKAYYDEKGSTYDDYSKQLFFKVYDAVTWRITGPFVPKDSAKVVFDAAGGTGKWSIPIAQCGPRVVLGDISEGMLQTAKAKITQAGLQDRIETRICDLRSLEFEDESFDLVFCDHALCFIKEQETVINELVRILKKNHPLILSAQNRYVLSLTVASDDIDYSFRILSGESQFIMRKQLKVYALSPLEFRRMLEDSGVRIEKISGKVFTMPLNLPDKTWYSEEYSDKLLKQILKIEFHLTERTDTLPLAAHMQAIALKR